MTHTDALTADLAATLGTRVAHLHPISGGDISQAYRVVLGDDTTLFAKTRADVPDDFFEKEADGLRALQDGGVLSVPGVQAVNASWIVLDWIEPQPLLPRDWETLGERLAAHHRHNALHTFGYAQDNYIGLTQQTNPQTTDPVAFWRDARLAPQLDLARRAGRTTPELDKLGAQLLGRLPDLLPADVPACLLHGDLWRSNVLCAADGAPFLIDPAVYYGPREAEIALCHLFGGFDTRFFDAYNATWPLEKEAEDRRSLYAIYHLLNHLNLFGGAYQQQVLDVLRHYA